MKKYAKILDHSDLVRDVNSKGVINIDNTSMNKYKQERLYRLKLNQIVSEYDKLKSDIEEIKSLIKKLLEKPI